VEVWRKLREDVSIMKKELKKSGSRRTKRTRECPEVNWFTSQTISEEEAS